MTARMWTGALALALVGCNGGGKDSASTNTGGTTPTTGTATGGTTSAQPPRAENDLADVDEAGSVNINVANNDLVTSNPLALGSVTVVDPPQFGMVTAQTNGTVDYTHDGSETTSDSFTYTIEDSLGTTSNLATVQITVAPVNDVPVATDDAGTVDQFQSVNLDLAANDIDVDDGLDLGSITIIDAPAYGTLAVNNDGTVDYTQDGTSETTDSFTYTIADISGAVSNTATVSLTVYTSNQPPTAADDFIFATEGGQITHDLAANDFDPDGTLDLTSIVLTTQPTNGTATLNGDGTVDYAHDGSETLSDSFTYTILDNGGAVSNIANVQVGVAPVNDGPTANDDTSGVTENQSVNVDVIANDSDPDDGLDPASVTVVTQPSDGTLTVNPDGTVDYQHDGSQNLADSFTYTVSDYAGVASNTATVDLAIQLVNDPPVASDDSAVVDEGSTVNVDLVANDIDTDDAIDLTSLTLVSLPANGLVTVYGNGTVDYAHDGSETVSDSFTYTVDDAGGGTSNLATVTVTVNPVNDPPSASNDSYTVVEGTSGNTLDIAANDSDVDDGLDLGSINITGGPARGTVFVNGDGTVDYDHDGSEFANDQFTYTIADNSGTVSGGATVTLSILPVNDPPSATADSFAVNEGGNGNLAVLSNDTDADDGIDPASIQITGAPANGTVNPQPGGTVQYVHDGSETNSDSFSYRVSDFAGANSNTVSVSITVNPVNDPPVAVDDVAPQVDEGQSVTIDLWSNDGDVDNALAPNSIVVVSPPSEGSVISNGDGTVDYIHNPGGGLADSFTYTIDDVAGATSNTALVTVTIDPAPVVSGGMIYGVRESGDTVITIDPITQALSDVGPLGTVFEFGELAWDSTNQVLYMVDGRGAQALWTVDINTGAASQVGVHGITDLFGLAHDPRTDKLYASQFNTGDVYEIDRNTGAATFLATTTSGGDGMTFDSTRQQLILLGHSGGVVEFDPFTYASTTLASPGTSNNNGVGYDPINDVIWNIDWSGNLWTHDPNNAYVRTAVQTGLGAHDGLTFVGGADGAHLSEPFVPDANQSWWCGGTEQVYYAYYGELSFDECEIKANATGTQWYSGISSPYTQGWVGHQDATQAATSNPSDWQNELIVPRTDLHSCVLGEFDDYAPAPPAPVENIYFDPGTGRVWHYWDLVGVTHAEAIAFGMDHGARIINPNSVGMTGLNRMTAPIHWCHAGAEFNGLGWCNSNDICDFYVGYWD